ncbi:unnamed protein product [Caenorhabditis auriculariae]|uniref:Uncharacterized protein n=1 Tax=Caenorhabditis auriculariae TaxID=2777116 RepID=A0A8S1HPZ1_9PELO|nr:unnamed protein product [Caenorhabditis auriculariae]
MPTLDISKLYGIRVRNDDETLEPTSKTMRLIDAIEMAIGPNAFLDLTKAAEIAHFVQKLPILHFFDIISERKLPEKELPLSVSFRHTPQNVLVKKCDYYPTARGDKTLAEHYRSHDLHRLSYPTSLVVFTKTMTPIPIEILYIHFCAVPRLGFHDFWPPVVAAPVNQDVERPGRVAVVPLPVRPVPVRGPVVFEPAQSAYVPGRHPN